MIYDLTINQHNIKPHFDIERDIQQQKEGLFSFTLRVNQGNIEDYAKFRTVTIAEYRSVTFTVRKESPVSHDPREGSTDYAVRPGVR